MASTDRQRWAQVVRAAHFRELFMALGTCRDCGEQVSYDARVCPKCGADAPTLTGGQMRRAGWLKFILVVIVIFSLILWFGLAGGR